MATANPTPESISPAAPAGISLLVVLASMPQVQLEEMLSKLSMLSSSISAEDWIIATPDEFDAGSQPGLQIISSNGTKASWTLTASDFTNAYELAGKNGARAILMLGPESASLGMAGLSNLASAALNTSIDLAVPFYELPPRAGMVNSAILYPLTRALFSCRARFPLAVDLGLSLRMAERLAAVGQRFTVLNQSDALLWPTHEASVAGWAIHEFDVGQRTVPQPSESDLNAILALVTGSLFADVDAKAAFWQRTRNLPPARSGISQPALVDSTVDIGSMVEAFHLAYTNLREIWSLVLPPNTLFGLKRLSIVDAASFRMPDNLWARIVFDFLVAYRLRTINRGHLLGALIPLYLAWVASHINVVASGIDSERHIETVAAAFEADKPYLVSRWRWPDRFNP